MTTREMMMLKLEGVSLKKIGEMCGISKQAVYKRLKKLYSTETISHTRYNFDIDEIIFKGIYEYFENTPKLTVEQFYRRANIGCSKETLKSFMTGKRNSRLTIQQINKLCEFVGKNYEDVFIIRGTESFLYPETNLLKVDDENDNIIASTDFNDKESRLGVWKALGLAEEDFYKWFD